MSGSCGNPLQDAEALVPVPLNFAAADYFDQPTREVLAGRKLL
jgi:hypothetical protein